MNTENEGNNRNIIKVIGVGGGGSNAVNHMFRLGIKDVEFVICNTDSQALEKSPVPHKIQLGMALTEGRGAGNKPEQGKQSAIENLSEIEEMLSQNTKMAFITAGMGGGTGTGAAPIIAKTAQEMGILTVGIVTIPFRFEGQRRLNQAKEGIIEISEFVDSLLVISNEKLREIHGDLTISDAFSKADNVLTIAAKGIAEIITVHGYVNVDFADVETVMRGSGVAIMGSATAMGENRAIDAIRDALTSPLLNNNNINGATNILLNITSGKEEATMSEIGRINDFVQECAGSNANIIWGNGTDTNLNQEICVTVIATGFKADIIPELYSNQARKTELFELGGNRSGNSRPVKVVQQEIDFSVSHSEGKSEGIRPGENFQKISGSGNRPQNQPQPQENRTWRKTEEIDEMETVPAYKRKGLQIDNPDPHHSSNVPRYYITEEDGQTVIKKNKWLHDKAD
ncbi:MAG: cell division protein FtsZ [Bacteroidales bacterium]|nr:cell division protein FtsZ [Bacteroidales bacterium]MCF8454340.1 cell division protein FtsZ [Bacteroidales bacterium]